MGVAENKALLRRIFDELLAGNSRALLSRTAENSRWTVTGSCPVSATYSSRQEFYDKALAAITRMLTARVKPTVRRILGDGEHVIVEWCGESKAKSGIPYNNEYCWVLTLKDGVITEGVIYCDTALVSRLFAESGSGS